MAQPDFNLKQFYDMFVIQGSKKTIYDNKTPKFTHQIFHVLLVTNPFIIEVKYDIRTLIKSKD